ncbi:hypothetical protein M8494_18025 [Serratia ureilytica]
MTTTIEQQAREEWCAWAPRFPTRLRATGSAGNLSLLLPDGTLLATPTGSLSRRAAGRPRCLK